MNKDTVDSTLYYTPSEVVKNSTVQNMSEPMAPLGDKMPSTESALIET